MTGKWKMRRLVEGGRACAQCGFDLVGLPPDAGLCPECGAVVG